MFIKKKMDLISHLVTVKLGNKFFYTVEFQFQDGCGALERCIGC